MSEASLHQPPEADDSLIDAPRLSVVIASYNSARTIGACLESLERQPPGAILETIVVDSSSDGTGRLVQERFPNVRLFEFSERMYPGTARNLGISVARGEIVAIVDADCVAEKNWASEVLKAHESPDLAIGGAIGNGNPESLVGWAAYFCEFSKWMPTSRAAWLTDIAAASMSYKRRAFAEYGDFIDGTYCSDTEFHWRMARDGRRLRFVPSILVNHRNIDSIVRFLKHEHEHGRSFARIRVRGQKFSKRRRLGYALAFPLVASRLFLQAALSALSNRRFAVPFLKASPLVMLGLVAWSSGECLGYLVLTRRALGNRKH